MSADPIHPGKLRDLFMDVSLRVNSKEQKERVYLKVPEKFTLPSSEEGRKKFEEELNKRLSGISPNKGASITQLVPSFTYSEADVLKGFDYGDTIVLVNLPYCLHLPNWFETEVNVPEKNIESFVIFEKCWTLNAQEEDKKSDDIDFYAEDKVLYFNNITMLTPVLPLRTEEGWAGLYKGTNIEKAHDQGGIFRYTRLTIQLKTNLSKEEEGRYKEKGEGKGVSSKDIAGIKEKVLAISNKILDVYRDVTKESYVRRRSDINMHMVYFKKPDVGIYPLPMNLEGAKINRSRIEIEEVKKQLTAGKQPELYKLLSLDAQQSFESNNYTLAVTESFQSLEVFLENFLIHSLKSQGYSETKAISFIEEGGNWRTPTRLKSLLRLTTGKSLTENTKLWTRWVSSYNKVRTGVIHKGKEPTKKEVEDTIEANNETIEWVSKLTPVVNPKGSNLNITSCFNSFWNNLGKLFKRYWGNK